MCQRQSIVELRLGGVELALVEIETPEIVLRDRRVSRVPPQSIGRNAGAVVMKRLLIHSARTRHDTEILRCHGGEMRIADFVRHVEGHRVQRDRAIEVAALPRDVRAHNVAVTEADAVRNLVGELLCRRDRLQRAIVLGIILMRARDPPQHGHRPQRIAGDFQ